MILVIWIIWQVSGWSATEVLLAKKGSNERKKEGWGGKEGRMKFSSIYSAPYLPRYLWLDFMPGKN